MKKSKPFARLAFIVLPILCFSLLFTIGTVGVFAFSEEYPEEATTEEIDAIEATVARNASARKPAALIEAAERAALNLEDDFDPIVSRTLTLKDFDRKNKYVYTEFINGGYAIYDRPGNFVYERTERGEGPYSACKKSGKLYYGGPTNYFVKEKNLYRNIITNITYDKNDVKSFYLSSQNIRKREIENRTSQQNLILASEANSETLFHFLGEKISTNDPNRANVILYFPMLGYHMINYYKNNTGLAMVQMLDKEQVAFGYNKYGSCSMVAASMIMKFYEDLGIRKMAPDDLTNFRNLYNIQVPTKNGKKYVTELDKFQYRAEWIHQELNCCLYPEKIGQSSFSVELGTKFLKLKDGIKTFFSRHENFTDTTRRIGRFGIESQIRNGNPVIVNFSGDYTMEGNTYNVGQHAATCYSYTVATDLFPEIAKELVVNFGWHQQYYGEVFISPNSVVESINFDVY